MAKSKISPKQKAAIEENKKRGLLCACNKTKVPYYPVEEHGTVLENGILHAYWDCEPVLVTHVNRHEVIGWVQTEVQSDGSRCGVIIAKRPVSEHGGDGFVTAWYRQGDREWSHGHYFSKDEQTYAWNDFIGRARGLLAVREG